MLAVPWARTGKLFLSCSNVGANPPRNTPCIVCGVFLPLTDLFCLFLLTTLVASPASQPRSQPYPNLTYLS